MKNILQKLESYFHKILNSPLGFQLLGLSFLIILVTSFNPIYTYRGIQNFNNISFHDKQNEEYLMITEEGFFDNNYGISTAGLSEVTVIDENGNKVVQLKPKKREKTISYIVKSGETVSEIAHKFGLNVSTINWTNNITSKSILRVGQKLKIPPTDGIYYKVVSGDTLSEIAKVHDVDIKKIYSFNSFDDKSTLSKDQEIFIPDAKKVYIVHNLNLPNKKNNNIIKKAGNNSKPQVLSSNSYGSITIGSIGYKLLKPTQGLLTQGYHRGHYALDIANQMNTPIYATAGGTVIKSSDGWNYGYGNYIVIDHGNNVQTLYAHNNIRKVSVGETVKRGQLIALMGNTGNVFGVTGIHLHFELRLNGRKVNPANYF